MSWKTESFGPQILTKEGIKPTEEALAGKKLIGIYFSAHWCPPCRAFTPQLAGFYNEVNRSDKHELEIVFVSSDNDSSAFDEYFKSMPWVSLPYSSRSVKETLSSKYGVKGIPTLVILDGNDGSIKDVDARSTVLGSLGNAKKTADGWMDGSVGSPTADHGADDASMAGVTLCLLCCCALPCVLSLIAAFIAYYVFGILFMVQDYSICGDASYLWVFTVIVILTPLAEIFAAALKLDLWGRVLFIGAVVTALFVYGAVILFGGFVCDAMKTEGLYIWALVAWSFIVMGFAFSFCGTVWMMTISKETWSKIEEAHKSGGTLDPTAMQGAFGTFDNGAGAGAPPGSNSKESKAEEEPLIPKSSEEDYKDLEKAEPEACEPPSHTGGEPRTGGGASAEGPLGEAPKYAAEEIDL